MTLKDISRETGVSIATVSRVLNKIGNVSEETSRRVLEAARQGGYFRKIQENARKGNVIAVVVPDLGNPFFTDLVRGIQERAIVAGKEVVVMNTCEDSGMEKRAIHLMESMNLCGMIITPVSDQGESGYEAEVLLKGMNVPVVLVDRDVKNSSFDGVFLNNIQGAFEVTEYLLEQGAREIAVISGPVYSRPGRERLQGYYNALGKYQIPVDSSLVLEGDFSLESGYRLTKRLLERESLPGAILCCNNLMTLGCVKALNAAGIRIGQDILLAGFDEIEMLELLGTNVVTVCRPTVEMGHSAADILLLRLNEPTGERRIGRRIELMPALKGAKPN